MERIAVAIPIGTYRGYKRWSNANKAVVVGIDVPGRTDIEIHSADWASQLEGCIATGGCIDSEQAFADSNNKEAFNKLMAALPVAFTVIVEEA